jgi:hypothetical protein
MFGNRRSTSTDQRDTAQDGNWWQHHRYKKDMLAQQTKGPSLVFADDSAKTVRN